MFGVNQHFGKFCSCHFLGGYEVGQVLETLYRAGSDWLDKFDGADWWNGGVGCYPVGEEHVVEERR
jgi:hypothetical protein